MARITAFEVIEKMEQDQVDRLELYTWQEAQEVLFAGILSGLKMLVMEDDQSHAFLVGIVRKKNV